MAPINFFKSYFYGKSGKADFTEADLPANRLQLFFDVLKVRRGSMVGLNFLYLLIWLPAMIWTYINFIQLLGLISGTLAWEIESLCFSYLLILFPLVAITGPFTAGISYVMRNWARDEHAFPFLDFKQALKENWKQALLLSAINGALPLIVFICFMVYSGMAQSSPLFYLPVALVFVIAILWNLSAQLIPTMIVTYKMKFPQLAKNAVIITIAALPRAILAKLITWILPLLVLLCILFFPAALSWVGAIAVVLYAVFMLSFNKLITASYANYACEKYLNPKIDGAQLNIGLRPKGE